jgi:hypothetical protein
MFLLKHRAGNKCRLSLRESSVLRIFRGAKDDNKKPHDANLSEECANSRSLTTAVIRQPN